MISEPPAFKMFIGQYQQGNNITAGRMCKITAD